MRIFTGLLLVVAQLWLQALPGYAEQELVRDGQLPSPTEAVNPGEDKYWSRLPGDLDPSSGSATAALTQESADFYWDSLSRDLDPRKEADRQSSRIQLNEGTLLGSKFPNLEIAMQSPFGTVLGGHAEKNVVGSDPPVVIDNDEVQESRATIEYKELPTDEGKTRVRVGAEFPVVILSEISSKTAKEGDPIQARLKYDLKIGDRTVAPRGCVVNGHINYCLRARCALHCLLSTERWYRNSGCLGVGFDEIINGQGEHLPLVAVPARRARIVKNKGEGRVLGVNHLGQVTGPWSQQLRYKAIRVGLNFALAPAGVFSFGAMPVALGLIGAANPSFAFMKPVGLNVRHRRIKGFAWGFLSGVPGSWLIEDTVIKGQEAIIKPGDEFLVAFRQEFTGEPSTEAELIPGASAKVHGQVMPSRHKRKK